MRPPRSTATLAVLLAVVVATASGCGGDGGTSGGSGTEDESGPFAATATAPASVAMMDAPADFSEVDGDGFVISTPGEFQQRRTTSSNGEPMLVLEKPSRIASIPQRVAVIRDVDPKQAADEQSFALESSKAAGNPDADVQRYAMPAPEGESAFLITWQEIRPGEGTDNVPVTYWQLMHQVNEELILNVVAYAPADEFETSEVSRILRTFEPSRSSSA